MFSFWRKRRLLPRKIVRAQGIVLINGHEFSFSTEDLSIEGAQLRVTGNVDAPNGLEIELSIDNIDVAARGTVCWSQHDGDEVTMIGLKFSDLEGIAGVERLQHEA